MLLSQAGLLFPNNKAWVKGNFSPDEIIEMKHLIIPFAILVLGHIAGWLVFLFEIILAICKYEYYTNVFFSLWYFADRKRTSSRQMLPTQQQGNETLFQRTRIVVENIDQENTGHVQPDHDEIMVVEEIL
jgi:membrane protein implicated in regulation of membrane protease activity